MTDHALTLIGRRGCHLCDDARAVVTTVIGELADEPGTRTLVEIDIDDDADAHATYWDQIPVLLIDGKVHNFFRIDPHRLRAALL